MLVDDTGVVGVVGVPGKYRFVFVTVHVAEIAKAGMDSLVLQVPMTDRAGGDAKSHVLNSAGWMEVNGRDVLPFLAP
jgi:hypothetical protein